MIKFKQQELPELMTIGQLQDYFSIGKDTAYNLVKKRTFPAFKVGREWRINKDDLVSWERANAKIA